MIALDPSQTFEIPLPGTPPEKQAVFTCRYLTARQLAEFDRLTDEANKLALQPREQELLLQALAIGETVLRGRPEETGKALDELLTVREMWDLANEIPVRQRVAERDRKKSASQSPSATVPSASGAAGVAANGSA